MKVNKDEQEKVTKIFKEYAQWDNDLYDMLIEFRDYRAEDLKRPLTERAAKMLVKKLKENFNSNIEVIEGIERCIMSGWRIPFPSNN